MKISFDEGSIDFGLRDDEGISFKLSNWELIFRGRNAKDHIGMNASIIIKAKFRGLMNYKNKRVFVTFRNDGLQYLLYSVKSANYNPEEGSFEIMLKTNKFEDRDMKTLQEILDIITEKCKEENIIAEFKIIG